MRMASHALGGSNAGRMSADDKQTPHLGIASLADPIELLPTPGREFPRNKADEAAKCCPDRNGRHH